MTGWNLPPGCTDRMIDDAMGANAHCEVCLQHVDSCVCPECPTCGDAGNPHCYQHHGLEHTAEQLDARARAEKAQADEDAYWEAYAEEMRYAEKYSRD